MAEETTFDEYRTGYISERFGLPKNAARALQLFELGYSVSGAASRLPVTESTVSAYHDALSEKISPRVVMPLAGKGRDGSLDVWGDRPISQYGDLSYEDGVADAKSKDERTVPSEEIDPQFREREVGINRGADLSEIDTSLVTLEVDR